ncbi:MAG TPA: universal stress protein [Planctomycetota bacterium]
MMLDRILVPLDGSPLAETALPPLAWLAPSASSEVVLARACPLRPVGAYEAAALMPVDVEDARDYLERTAARLRAEGHRVRTLIREGEAAESILDAAAEEGATLVLMATHGRGGLARFVFGSVAEKVLRASVAPVMIFPAFSPPRSQPPTRLLVPLRSDEAARGLLPAVVELARRGGARVTLLHVAAPGEPADPGAPFLQAAAASLAAEGVEAGALVLGGDPATRILETVGDADVDMLVMAARGRRGPSRWIFGSVTEKVLPGAGAPLLVVRDAPVSRVIAWAKSAAWKE